MSTECQTTMPRRPLWPVLVPMLAALALPGAAPAAEQSFVAIMNGANGVPPIDTPATGIAQMVLDTETLAFRYDIQLFDLPNFTMMHIHLGGPDVDGPLVYTLSRDRSITHVAGQQVLNPIDLPDLMNGGLYVNAHTTAYPGGEIRGQLYPRTVRGRTAPFAARLSPANEVPAVDDLDAGAAALFTLDLRLVGNEVVGGFAVFDVDYHFAQSVNLTGLHLHAGAVGVPGPVVIGSGLTGSVDPDGRGRVVFRVPARSAADLQVFSSILADPGAFYLNLHTESHPGGALRGQLRRGLAGQGQERVPTGS